MTIPDVDRLGVEKQPGQDLVLVIVVRLWDITAKQAGLPLYEERRQITESRGASKHDFCAVNSVI